MDLTGQQPGTFTAVVEGFDRAGNPFRYVLGSYELVAAVSRVDTPPVVVNPRPVPPAVGPGGGRPGDGGTPPGDGLTEELPNQPGASPPDVEVPRSGGSTIQPPTSSGAPSPEATVRPLGSPDRPFAQDLQVPQAIADAVTGTFKKPQLPLALLVIVVLFLLVQNRIDRRDPKLAGAPSGADDDLTFGPAFRPGGAPA